MRKVMRSDILKSARFAGDLKRYHTWPTIQQQTNAAHTWNCLRIYLEIWGTLSPTVATYLVYHDAGELKVGDLPFPIKAKNPALKKMVDVEEAAARADMGVELPELTNAEKLRVKFVDVAEMHEFGIVEVALGNKLAFPIVTDTANALRALCEQMSRQEAPRAYDYLERVSRWSLALVHD